MVEYADDAGSCTQALHDGLCHRRVRGAAAEKLRRDGQRNRDHSRAVEALVQTDQRKIAANVKDAANEQHDCKRHLRDCQGAAPEETAA